MSVVVRIALLRPMARLDPVDWGPRLAEALITRSQVVSALRGGTARRTAAADEAVALCRRLVADPADRHRTTLARALVARAGVPDVRPTTVVTAELTEAIGYVEGSSDRLGLVALATARLLLARRRSQLGEVREALALARLALRAWADAEPLTADDRARRINTLLVVAECAQTLERHDEALDVRRQARDAYRALPWRYRLRWKGLDAATAVPLASSMAADGRHREALDLLTAADLALELTRSVTPEPGHVLSARALLVESLCRQAMGEVDAAERTVVRAVDLLRPWVGRIPDGGGAHLASALRAHGALLLETGRADEGVARLEEAAEVAREVGDIERARSLVSLVWARMTAGAWDDVEPLLAELLPLCRRRADDLPEVFRPLLVTGLYLVTRMTDSRRGDAEPPPPGTRISGLTGTAAGREAVALARALVTGQPAHRTVLRSTLFGLVRVLRRSGDVAGAADAMRECVAVLRELADEDPAHRADLSRALGVLGLHLDELGRLDEAYDAHRESVEQARAVDGGLPPAEMADALRDLGRSLAALGRLEEAGRAHAEADRLPAT
ncbi:tetratricopeptide repeat protein [Micromonospora sp. WMMA1949]|uniref:tetratricopeptide repeat protein n=1 Tax=Micromonospora sp. WMMA1949 TaxID=3015162 RepID=UPI0022B60267|nr:tetratricopeptide repeat protein [Micromonospora sp. WMMA1949]MCZ7425295.1 tetratricopeptide repeat protein [Micromonospora sp. WMMA1949]